MKHESKRLDERRGALKNRIAQREPKREGPPEGVTVSENLCGLQISGPQWLYTQHVQHAKKRRGGEKDLLVLRQWRHRLRDDKLNPSYAALRKLIDYAATASDSTPLPRVVSARS